MGEFHYHDLRRFVTTCAELRLDVVIRIGPAAHGGPRDGGFPVWVLDVDGTPRTDDPRYLELVWPLLECADRGSWPAAGSRPAGVERAARGHRGRLPRGLRPRL
ncbi:beta-galactosidase [[Actinomadura] parvosata]|uniref:beta-galactosidase n=1 Tax=[Actinomadura] parvosata TaxID=1955412 RepID=UPI00406C5673